MLLYVQSFVRWERLGEAAAFCAFVPLCLSVLQCFNPRVAVIHSMSCDYVL